MNKENTRRSIEDVMAGLVHEEEVDETEQNDNLANKEISKQTQLLERIEQSMQKGDGRNDDAFLAKLEELVTNSKQKPEKQEAQTSLVTEDGELNVDALLSRLTNSIDESVNRALEERINPLKESMSQHQKYIEQSEIRKIQQEFADLQKEFGDLTPYKATILELSKTNPNLSARDLVLLSRSRMGHNLKANPESEKPDSAVGSSTRKPMVSMNKRKTHADIIAESVNRTLGN